MDNEKSNKFVVVINYEEQYSIWPAEKLIPEGWRSVFGPAEKDACLEKISIVWTDMRPKSLKDAMDSGAPR